MELIIHDLMNWLCYKGVLFNKLSNFRSRQPNVLECPMVKTKYGDIPKAASVGGYVKLHTVQEGEIIVSVQKTLFTI